MPNYRHALKRDYARLVELQKEKPRWPLLRAAVARNCMIWAGAIIDGKE